MGQPTEKDFERASKLLHTNVLEYSEAVVCIRMMKAFLRDEKIPCRQLNRFRHITNRYTMTGQLKSGQQANL